MTIFFCISDCVFQHRREVPWSSCDFSTQVRFKRMNLIKKKSKKNCPNVRTLTKPCNIVKKSKSKTLNNISFSYQSTSSFSQKESGLEECTLDISSYGNFLGSIIIELRKDIVPKTVKNFQALCLHQYGFGYKNSTFHSIKPNLKMEGGDFERRDGTGGHSIYGRTFPDENFILKHKKFAVSMANRGRKNTNGSKFFITSAKLPKYTLFSRSIHSFDVWSSI